MIVPKKFTRVCVACGAVGAKITKEHFWPQWLIERTGTHRTTVRFTPMKRINPRALVIPMCARCNNDFGSQLESPVCQIFRDLEAGQGLSDIEVELLVRWLWKFEGLAWSLGHPDEQYMEGHSLRERVLLPIGDVRQDLTVAVSLVESINPGFGDAPMGLDSWNEASAVFVAGVFSRVALMVLERQFEAEVPTQFTTYRFAERQAPDRSTRLFHPRTGFRDCVQAVTITREIGLYLSHAHDLVARNRPAVRG
jgi:hypothetical protein